MIDNIMAAVSFRLILAPDIYFHQLSTEMEQVEQKQAQRARHRAGSRTVNNLYILLIQ